MADDYFAKPQKLIDRADSALNEAHGILGRFFGHEGVTVVVEQDPQTGDYLRKIKVIRPIPDRAEERITDSLNNLRNSFDQMLFAACRAIKRPLRDGHYPWASGPTDLDDWKLRNKKTGKETIPSELWDVIRSQQPYPRGDGYEGGRPLERAVATLANRKHTVGFEVAGQATDIMMGDLTIPPGTEFGIPFPSWDPIKNEMVIYRWKGSEPQIHREYGVTFHVFFDETAPADLRGVPAVLALKHFAAFAQLCLNGFQTRCRELMG